MVCILPASVKNRTDCGTSAHVRTATCLTPLTVRNESGDEDSFTLGQFGFVVGGPVVQNNLFYFASFERKIVNATEEQSFAVPSLVQRGAFGTGDPQDTDFTGWKFWLDKLNLFNGNLSLRKW